MENIIKNLLWAVVLGLFYCWLVFTQQAKKNQRAREEREAEETARKLSGRPVEPPAAPKDSAKRP